MITLKDLLLGDLSRKSMQQIAGMSATDKTILLDLWKLAVSDDEPVNWRAAWMIKGIHEIHPHLVKPLIGNMIDALPHLKKEGVKREFLRMIMEHPLPEDEEKLGLLLDNCFKWLANPPEPIAVKVHCMTILFEISKVIPEIKPELITTIEVAMEEGSAGIVNRGSKTIKAIKRGKQKIG